MNRSNTPSYWLGIALLLSTSGVLANIDPYAGKFFNKLDAGHANSAQHAYIAGVGDKTIVPGAALAKSGDAVINPFIADSNKASGLPGASW